MRDSTVALEAPRVEHEVANESPPRSQAPAAIVLPRPAPEPSGEDLRAELSRWRDKAIALDRNVFEMRALLQSGKGFSQILNTTRLLSAFMEVCRERYGVTTSCVLLEDDLDPDNVFYRVKAFHGLPATYVDARGDREDLAMFRLPRNDGLLWQLVNQGDVFSVRDMRRQPRFRTAFNQWDLSALQSNVWVPLMHGGKVLGILTLGWADDADNIPENEYTFLQEIAAVAATNIDSTLKYENNQRILKNLQTLYDVNHQLAHVNDFKKLTIETLATAVNALRAQKANLMLLNPETNELEIKVVWGNIPKSVRDDINSGRAETRAFAIGEGVAGQAAKTRRPVRINDRRQIPQVGKTLAYCMLSAPLVYGGELLGVMTLTNKVQEGPDGVELDTIGRFDGQDEQLLLNLADQAASNLRKARLWSESTTDRLTGLSNTRYFEDRFHHYFARAAELGQPMCLAVTDIDHFKRFNDTHGHKAGDEVLARTANILGDMVREGSLDCVFRYGGEEFCMVLPDTDAATAAVVLEDYRQRVEALEVEYEDKILRVNVSVGVAQSTGFEDRKKLFESADRALYASKAGGRNRVTVSQEDGTPAE